MSGYRQYDHPGCWQKSATIAQVPHPRRGPARRRQHRPSCRSHQKLPRPSL